MRFYASFSGVSCSGFLWEFQGGDLWVECLLGVADELKLQAGSKRESSKRAHCLSVSFGSLEPDRRMRLDIHFCSTWLPAPLVLF